MKGPQAEIISIGNEVLAGLTINTNAAFISQKLADIGLPVSYVTTIRDDHNSILQALQKAAERADAVLITGGLGPTPDDITKNAVCAYFNVPLHENALVLEDVQHFLEEKNLKISESNRLQAVIPECDILVRNKIGTAPGLGFIRDNAHFFFMPGVPREMKTIMTDEILGYLQKNLDLRPVSTRLLRTTGIPESYLHEKIYHLVKDLKNIETAYLPREIGVDLRLRTISGRDADILKLDELTARLRDKIGKYIFTDQEIEMQEVICRLLAEKKLTFTAAESFTGGLIQDWLTDISGSSAYFLGGIVSYSNESKIQLLGVKEDTLKALGAVSEQTALEMLQGVCNKFKSDCAISTTGIAGPTGATDTKPVGLCFTAVKYKDIEVVKQFNFGSIRRTNKKRGAMAGLEILRRLILGIEI